MSTYNIIMFTHLQGLLSDIKTQLITLIISIPKGDRLTTIHKDGEMAFFSLDKLNENSDSYTPINKLKLCTLNN